MYKILTIVLALFTYSLFAEETLVVFSANWCKFCKDFMRDIDDDTDLLDAISKYDLVYTDIDIDKDLAKKHKIKSVPTFIIFKNNREIKRKIGYQGGSQNLISFLRGRKGID
jgi:thioredoxin 1